MRLSRKRKCLHCHEFFRPDARNVKKQEYCSRLDCRKASKAASQKKWLAKPENKNYFRGPDNVSRVREWRKQNPGYWKKGKVTEKALQDHSIEKITDNQDVAAQFARNALQDLLSVQPVVFLGLLAQLSGSALQDDIVTTGRRLQQLGQDILTQPLCCKGGQHVSQQTANPSTHGP